MMREQQASFRTRSTAVTTLPCPPTFHLTPEALHFTGPGDRFQKNLAALRLVHELEAEGRAATDEERLVLAHYSAFGESALLNRLFHYDPVAERYVLQERYATFLSSDDANALRAAALTAFYTPLDIVSVIWQAVLQLGLGTIERPRIIEPAAGVGHFISAMPPELRERAEITAVELDPVTARILGHIHPDIALHAGVGFERVDLPPNGFDLAISNVPFGDMAVHDPSIPAALRHQLHDFFFAKALRLVRPGGLVIFLTSWGTLDKQARAVRSFLAEQATLLGAFRLPNGVFRRISGSESATDLLIFQKKKRPAAEQPRWLATAEAGYPPSTDHRSMTRGSRYTREFKDPEQLANARVAVNQCWLDEPERVIGQPVVITHDNSLWLQVLPPAGAGSTARASSPRSELAEVIAAALGDRIAALLPSNVVTAFVPERDHAQSARTAALPLHERRADQIAIPTLGAVTQERAAGLANIYNAAKTLIRAELSDAPEMEAARERLNRLYEQFSFQFGVIHDPRNQKLFSDLPELQFLLALERNLRRLPSGRWAAERERIFVERTLRPHQPALPGTLTPTEALLRCLDERGDLDIDYIALLAGVTAEAALEALGERVYRLPGTSQYELADVYLSGNVVAKLRDARAWAERDPAFVRNVAALEAVQPTPLGPREIVVNLNAFWLPGEVLSAFIKTLLPGWTGSAFYSTSLGEWKLSDPGHVGADAVEATTRWGTTRADAITILQASLRGVPITVYDVITVGDQEKRVFNPTETVAAQEKQQELKAAFERWVWDDTARADELCRRYNERFNTVRMRHYDGSHLSFPGINASLLRGGDLARYQKGAVWQILQCQSTLLGFAVGGGKTFTAIAAAVEARRLGLCSKALAVVPKNLVGQWANEARRLYPGIKVLAMAPEDFTRQRRGVVLSRIATGDWDLIVISHTSFKLLPLSAELLTNFRDAETDRLRAYLEEQRATATSSDEKRSLKQIERAIKKLEEQLQRMLDGIARDNARTITWDELGVDMLIVDEFHEFKNLGVPTRLTNIAGLPSANSQRALDMRIKTWELRTRQKKLVALSATPIMNSIGEAYVMQLFLQEQQLEEAGIHHFDEWVSLYAQPKMAFEMKPDGSGFRANTRLATFVNLPEMSAMWRQVLNLRTKAQMGLPEPALVTGRLIPVVVPPSAALKRFVASLAERAEAVRSGEMEPTLDNLLKIVSDGRKAALDIRLVVPNAPRPRQSKIAALVATVAQLHHTYTPLRGTQLVFCDLATPKGVGRDGDGPVTRLSVAELEGNSTDDDGENTPQDLETAEERWLSNFVYYEIRDGLVALGVPRDEIAFIHEVTTKAQRDTLFAAVNEGRVRVLLGSTAKMSVGMNVQQRLIALHDLDCPWRPGDLEQRHGRILRQGNQWPEAYLFAYITEGSFDAFMWGTVETKARFIEQALVGEITARTIEDTSDVVLSAAEIKAIASGNPQVMRKVQLEVEVARLERVRAVWLDTRRNLLFGRQVAEEELRRLEVRHAMWLRAEAFVAAHPREPFQVEVAAGRNSEAFVTITERSEAGAAVHKLVNEYKGAAAFLRRRLQSVVARYRGLSLLVTAHELFGAELSLALPDGTAFTGVATNTDAGVWQSAGHTIGGIPETIQSLRRRCNELRERIATTDGELERLAAWDGQPTYDAALSELSALNATFAAAEEQDKAARAAASAPTGESTVAEVAAKPASTDEDEIATLAKELLALTRAEGARSGWDEWTPLIPPAPASLAWMAAELERQAMACSPVERPAAEASSDECEASQTIGERRRLDRNGKLRITFGELLPQRQAQKSVLPPHAALEGEASQLSLF
jgi:N12 class adenine-specific DNA methylase